MVSLRKSDGSAMLEAAVAMGLVTGVMASFFTISYFVFCSIWVDHISYMSALCLTTYGESFCENQARFKLESSLPWGSLESIKLSGSPQNNNYSSKIIWKLKEKEWKIEQQHLLTEKALSKAAKNQTPDLLW